MLLLLAALLILSGCQGLSAGNSSQDPGLLNFGSTTLDFGSVKAGTSETLTITAKNTESQSVTVNSVAITTKYFALTSPSLPVTVGAGQTVTLTLQFTPDAIAAFNATVTVTTDATNAITNLTLTGTGTANGQLAFSGASGDFGNVMVGGQQSQTVTLTNNGTTSVNIEQAAVSGSGFQMSGLSTPLTLNPAQSTTFTISFAPTTTGGASGTVAVASDAANPVLKMGLTGTGVLTGVLGSNPANLSFGTVPVGTKQTLSETLTNTGGSSITISQVAIAGGSGFTMNGLTAPMTLAAGQSASFSASFQPTAPGTVTGNITITSNGSNPTLTIPLSGTGLAAGTLGANPTSLAFGSVPVGNSKTLSETVTNSGGSTITISQVGVSGSGFSIIGITTPVTLTAGQSASFSVLFTPTAAGAVSGNVTITSTASNPTLNIPLTGTGVAVGALGSNPTSLAFGSVQVASSKTLSETVTNTGGTSVTISQVGVSGTGFSVSGITVPVTLTAGQSASFSVSFAPTAAGAVSGNVTITSTASNPTLTIPLSGTGVAAGALGSNPTSLSFGNVQIAHTQTLSETLTNTGSTSISISQVAISGTGFSVSGISTPITLTAGQSATFSVSFTPLSTGAKSGNVRVSSNASNPTLTIPLSGTGTAPGTLVSNPISLSFGSVPVSTTQTLSETLTNVGGSSSTISSLTASGTGFSVSGISTPVTLTPGQSATFSVSFTPPSAGAVNGDVTIISDASDSTFVVPLSGTGTGAAGQLSVAPTTLDLGSVQVGSSGTASGTLTASGANVTVTAAGSSSAAFSLSGLSFPVTIQAGQSASFTITFSPQTTGAASATVTFTSNAQPTTTTESLTGTGTPAPTHTVALSWNASTTTGVTGYNVYRAVYTSSCGSFSKINPTLNASMSYTDSAVSNGTSYCYAATAVDSNNAESAYSNIVSNLQIP